MKSAQEKTLATKSNGITRATAPRVGGKKPRRTFPTVSLEEALKVPQAIKTSNNGHPWESKLVARASGMTRASSKFFYYSSAARDYGLTIGTRDTLTIELTDLGRSIVYAENPDLEKQRKIEAFFKVEKFKQVYDYYNGSHLPEEQYLSNTLETKLQIPTAQHGEFAELFKDNCKYLGIENGLHSSSTKTAALRSSDAIAIRVLGQPSGHFSKAAFVIMPFSEKGKQERSKGFFDEVLKSLVTRAANNAGFSVQTARREDSDIIHHTIIHQLLNADLVIADLTDHNPNVLFELGIRLAKDKLVVLIKSKDTGPIFDVDNLMRVYPYDHNLWTTTIEADVKALGDRIKGAWDNRDSSASYMQILTVGPQIAVSGKAAGSV